MTNDKLDALLCHWSFLIGMRYLVVGHVCQDLTSAGWAFGGTVTYSARAARALGCDVRVITSTAPDLDLRPALLDIEVTLLPSDCTTTFENIYTPNGRQQILHAVASRLDFAKVDSPSLHTPPIDIVHLAPVAQEIDRGWLTAFAGASIDVTPQGWLRQWDSAGRVSPIEWQNATEVFQRAAATVISIEDVGGDESIVKRWAAQASVLVVTRGRDGCTVYANGRSIDVPAPAEIEIDPTGAGDIFATAFFVRLRQTHDPLVAARFATCIAAKSITRHGLDSVPTPLEMERCLTSTL
jgi:sugar/nucleoside kinase (ribokinase family)